MKNIYIIIILSLLISCTNKTKKEHSKINDTIKIKTTNKEKAETQPTIKNNIIDKEFLSSFLMHNNELLETNFINKYKSFDFSKIWNHSKSNTIYGIIGKNNQRLNIKLLSINKNKVNPNEYFIKGKSRVKKNICDFEGIIKISRIQECKNLYYGIDDMYIEDGIKKEGVLIAEYEFRENKHQKFSGIFKGKLYSKWYLDKDNKIHYDDLADGSDGYSNNAFIGFWKMYNSKLIKKCNWSDWRVPNATSDFDIGACCFSPNEKYYKYGWENYARANIEQNEEAKREEKKEWWK